MKLLGVMTALSVATTGLTGMAAADPWKDESGHGRWSRYEHSEKYWKPRRHYRERSGSRIYFEVRPAYRSAPAYRPAPEYRSAGDAHVAWCYSRYRSYREWDNSFQPYNGPRRPCYSPYN